MHKALFIIIFFCFLFFVLYSTNNAWIRRPGALNRCQHLQEPLYRYP